MEIHTKPEMLCRALPKPYHNLPKCVTSVHYVPWLIYATQANYAAAQDDKTTKCQLARRACYGVQNYYRKTTEIGRII